MHNNYKLVSCSLIHGINNFRLLITVHYGVKLQKKFLNAMSILSTEIYLDQIKHKEFLEDMLKC